MCMDVHQLIRKNQKDAFRPARIPNSQTTANKRLLACLKMSDKVKSDTTNKIFPTTQTA